METLIVERKDSVVTVTMNRPERKNAANNKMLTELKQIFAEVEDSDEDRVLVPDRRGRGVLLRRRPVGPRRARHRPLPLGPGPHAPPRRRRPGAAPGHQADQYAKVDGVAVGAGLSLALGCDLIVCSDRARLSMIFAKRGLALDNGASWLLPRLVGLARAKEIALFGGMWSGEEAAAIGLVNRALPPEELDAFVDDWATTLAAGPPLALSMTKTMLNGSSMSLDGTGGGGRGPLPGPHLLDQGHRGGDGCVRREARARLHRPLVGWCSCVAASRG